MERKEITVAQFEQIKETDFDYLHLKKYDPKIYKEIPTIELAEEMKQYSIVN